MIEKKEFSNFYLTKIDENTLLYRWDLNNIPNGINQILLLADLIKYCQENGYNPIIKKDKRLRASGLLVVFATKQK